MFTCVPPVVNVWSATVGRKCPICDLNEQGGNLEKCEDVFETNDRGCVSATSISVELRIRKYSLSFFLRVCQVHCNDLWKTVCLTDMDCIRTCN